jgi:chorismate mutase/prephenate dehydratase
MELDGLRQAIDAVDDELLRLLNRRAQLVEEVASFKEARQLPFYVPRRERAIIERLVSANPGPFPSAAIRPVFQEVFSACLSLEKGLRVAYLGPEATFTHMAVTHQFGVSARALPVGTIAGVFAEVEQGRADFGVVPVENSTEGAVLHTLDTFLDSALNISAEIILDITQCLLLRPGLELSHVQRVYSHPQALGQCRKWLAANLPHAALVETPSTAEAARVAREDASGAAIASELAGRLHDLVVAAEGIQDLADNATRFLVIGREQAHATGKDTTSVLVLVKDGPGALLRLLQPFSDEGVNLTKIESRPSRRRPWESAFFVDLEGHQEDPKVARALATLVGRAETCKVLGSYPRAERGRLFGNSGSE